MYESVTLLNLGFFIDNVFANHGVVFFELELVRCISLILCRCIVVTSTRTGDQFYFVSHRFLLYFFASRSQVCEHCVDTIFVNGTKTFG